MLSTLGYFDLDNSNIAETTFDWILDNLFYNLDYLLIGIYSVYSAYKFKSDWLKPQLVSFYGISYLVLFLLLLISSLLLTYDFNYDIINDFFVHSVRAFQLVLFLYLAAVLRSADEAKSIQFLYLFVFLEIIIALAFFYWHEAKTAYLGGALVMLLIGLWLSSVFANYQHRKSSLLLLIAVGGLVLTEIYYTLIFFEATQEIADNTILTVLFRLLGGLFELWILSILIRSYWPKRLTH